MKTYEGIRTNGATAVHVYPRDEGAQRLPGSYPLAPRFDLRRHSPDGFEWGYAGSGPAQLALALCADALQDDARAQSVYQDFKSRTVAHLHGDRWTLTEEEVRAAVAHIEKRQELAGRATEGGQQPKQPGPTLTPEEGRAAAEEMTAKLKALGYSEEEQRHAAFLDRFMRGYQECPDSDPSVAACLERMVTSFSAAMAELCEARGLDADRVMACQEAIVHAAIECAKERGLIQRAA